MFNNPVPQLRQRFGEQAQHPFIFRLKTKPLSQCTVGFPFLLRGVSPTAKGQKSMATKEPHGYIRTLNQGHGRIETLGCRAFTDPDWLETGKLGNSKQWVWLKATVKVRARWETAEGAMV